MKREKMQKESEAKQKLKEKQTSNEEKQGILFDNIMKLALNITGTLFLQKNKIPQMCILNESRVCASNCPAFLYHPQEEAVVLNCQLRPIIFALNPKKQAQKIETKGAKVIEPK